MKDFQPFTSAEYKDVERVREILKQQDSIPCTACRYCCLLYTSLALEELARLAGEVADHYVTENMPAEGRRFAYLVERLKRGVTRLRCV